MPENARVAIALDGVSKRFGSHTAVELVELRYNSGLDDEMFTQRRLEKGAS